MDKKANKTDLSVMRHRSSQASIADGYRLFVTRFPVIFRASWLAAVIYALAVGFVGYVMLGCIIPVLFGASPETSALSLIALSVMAYVVTAIVLASTAFDTMNEHKETDTIARPCRWFGRVSYNNIKRTIAKAVHFLRHIGRSRRHVGMVLTVLLMIVIASLVLTLIGQMPAHLLTWANILAQSGYAQGDPLGLPDNIGLINFATFAATGFIQAYIHMSALYPLYYAWGSIKTQNNTKTK